MLIVSRLAPDGFRGAVRLAALLCASSLAANAAESQQAALAVPPKAPAASTRDSAPAQSCDTTAYPRSTPAERFTDLGEGSLADRRLGLVWLRCALGQAWSQGTCTGSPTALSWDEARQEAARLNANGREFFDNWRLPRINELATLVERQCDNPRIDLTLFPGTPAAFFWSATPVPPGNVDAAYALSFGPEGVGHDPIEERHFVRLVRRGP